MNRGKNVRIKKYLGYILLLACAASASANDQILRLAQDPGYWVLPNGNYSNWRYSNLGQINNRNAGDLKLAWSFATGSLRNQVGAPLVLPAGTAGLSAATLFLATPYPNEVLAINLETQTVEWSYQSGADAGAGCCQSTNYGISYANGMIFLQQDDLNLVALNAANGHIVWKTKTGYGLQGYANINAPFPVGNYVLTNITDVNGVNVSIAAYRMSDGGLVWKAGSVGQDSDILFNNKTTELGNSVGANSSSVSWQAENFPQANYRTWPWLAWDSKTNLIYYGSAADKGTDPDNRPGEKLWTASIIARDLNTGVARWVYQMTPHNEWGYNGGNEMILANLTIAGKQVPALMHFDQNGFAYVLNRTTGALLRADKYDPAVNWASNINIGTGKPEFNIAASRYLSNGAVPGIVCPSVDGVAAEAPAAYSPHTGYVYLPTSHTCMVRSSGDTGSSPASDPEPKNAKQPAVTTQIVPAGDSIGDGTKNLGNVIAWDAAQGAPAWTVPEKWPVKSGLLVTAGDVVFYGTLDGYVKLVDAKTGSLLWRYKVPSGVAGNFITWMFKGKQYVGVLTGIDPNKLAELGLTDSDLYQDLKKSIRAGGGLMVFSLP